MDKQQFTDKYLKGRFFWITDEKQCNELQDIFLEFGLLLHTGSSDKINWHPTFTCLGTFKADQWHDYHYFQRLAFYVPNSTFGKPVNYEDFIYDYNLINQ